MLPFSFPSGLLREGNSLDLDIDIFGESLDSNAAAGGLVGKPLLVDRVHLLYRWSIFFSLSRFFPRHLKQGRERAKRKKKKTMTSQSRRKHVQRSEPCQREKCCI